MGEGGGRGISSHTHTNTLYALGFNYHDDDKFLLHYLLGETMMIDDEDDELIVFTLKSVFQGDMLYSDNGANS